MQPADLVHDFDFEHSDKTDALFSGLYGCRDKIIELAKKNATSSVNALIDSCGEISPERNTLALLLLPYIISPPPGKRIKAEPLLKPSLVEQRDAFIFKLANEANLDAAIESRRSKLRESGLTLQPWVNSKAPKKKFVQKYLKEWEREDIFKLWLKPVPNDEYHASCRHCNVKLIARKKDLTDHAKTSKHVNNVKSHQKETPIQKFLQIPVARETKIKELKLAAFIAEHSSMNTVDHLVRETASWFSYSHKRRAEYTALYQTLNDGQCPLKLSHLSMTRWLARRDIVGKILEQWDAFKLMFNIMKDKDRCYTTEQLYEMYNDQRNKLYLTFLHFILDEVCKVNVVFQSKNANPLLLFQELGECYMKLLKMVVVPDHMKHVSYSNCLDFEFDRNYMRNVMGINCTKFEPTAKMVQLHNSAVIYRIYTSHKGICDENDDDDNNNNIC
ncbi:hypothetical protein WDU94_015533 [Cyamophila willieti]